MNRADVVVVAIEHAIPASRLMLVARMIRAGGSRDDVASVLASYRPVELITGGGSLVASDAGLSGHGVAAEAPVVVVTWEELAGYLMSALTPRRCAELIEVTGGRADNVQAQRIRDVRSSLAYDTVAAGGLVQPSLFTTAQQPRLMVVGEGGAAGVQLGLVPLEPPGVACNVNDATVVTLRPCTERHQVRVDVGGTWSGVIRHIPPGDVAPALPATFADRVGVEVLDPYGSTGERWALQVDGFDIAIMETLVGVSGRRVRVAVYDQEPSNPFQRHECSVAVPPLPGTVPASRAATTASRLRERRVPPPSPPDR